MHKRSNACLEDSHQSLLVRAYRFDEEPSEARSKVPNHLHISCSNLVNRCFTLVVAMILDLSEVENFEIGEQRRFKACPCIQIMSPDELTIS